MKRLVAMLLLAAPLIGPAAESVVPGAGFMLQQIQPVTIPALVASETGLTLERPDGLPVPASQPFLVRTIRLTGHSVFPPATLQALVAEAEGQSLTLPQLGAVVARLADYYHRHGYALAQAIIPAQEIRDGIVVVEIIEGRFGEIRLENQSRVKSALLRDTLASLARGQAISQRGLDHALLLLADIPGVTVDAVLKPGATYGTSDLLVDTRAGPLVSGFVVLDDYGNRYTGRPRVTVTVNGNELLHQGDVLSVSGLSSGHGLNYGRLAYEILLNGAGTRVGGSYSLLDYQLGGPLVALQAQGTARLESLWVKHPLVRRRNFNLAGQLQYDGLRLQDHLNAGAIRTDRQLDNGRMSLAGDAREAWLTGGITLWRLDWTAGRVNFDNDAARLADAATARTGGGFSKGNLNLVHLQSLGPRDGLYLAFTGQWADGNLDSSEKMIGGGPYTVRGYDMGAVSGDSGCLGTVEWRHDLGFAGPSQWQAVAFFDRAGLKLNHSVWGTGPNRATLSGVGAGLNWVGPRQWSGKLCVARPVGPAPVLVTNPASVRLWLELSQGF